MRSSPVAPTTLERVWAREILDSRGNPTIEVEVRLESGALGRAAVPSGASTGAHEAHELRDGDHRFGGRGVLRAVEAVRDRIAPEILGRDAVDQRGLDDALSVMDATPNLASLGANAVLGVSLAAAKAVAGHTGLSLHRYLGGPGSGILPVPYFNVINGGAHADNAVDVQEFMVAPIGLPTFADALRAGAEIYACLRSQARSSGLNVNVGDEGGIAPDVQSTRHALDLIVEAVEVAGYEAGRDVVLALDVAATELWQDGSYSVEGQVISPAQMTDFLDRLIADYPIVSIEDGCAEEDWDGWAELTERMGHRVQLLGDDLLVTNPDRLARAIEEDCANAVLVKPNQIGTLTATLDTIALARRAGWSAMMSHRSGETEDTTIAHLAVATGVGQIKAGAPARGERTAKYNELLRIEEELGSGARYAGWTALPLDVGVPSDEAQPPAADQESATSWQ
ncbi:MAG TPA: phosphopyruvate hydratase [Actinomycetota bacterium]|nr:phosphopyruvate hydratase [Actinomycetota bacterium]